MDFFRKIFGLPRREEQIPFTPSNEQLQLPPERPFYPGNDFEDIEELHPPSHGLSETMDQEIREMERHMRDMWNVFGMGRLFSEDFGRMFEGFGAMSPGEGLPALPPPAAETPGQDADSLRKDMFKPSFLPPRNLPGQRNDEDLDNKVQKEGIGVILKEAEDSNKHRQPVSPFQFKSFSRSVSVQTIRRPDGSLETRRVERDSDGNEVVTITEHPADEHSPGFSGPFDSHPPGFPRLFGPRPGLHSPFDANPYFEEHTHHDPNHNDSKGLSIFEKIFGKS